MRSFACGAATAAPVAGAGLAAGGFGSFMKLDPAGLPVAVAIAGGGGGRRSNVPRASRPVRKFAA